MQCHHSQVKMLSWTCLSSPYLQVHTPHQPHTQCSPSHSRPTFLTAPHSQRPSHPHPMPKRASWASLVSAHGIHRVLRQHGPTLRLLCVFLLNSPTSVVFRLTLQLSALNWH